MTRPLILADSGPPGGLGSYSVPTRFDFSELYLPSGSYADPIKAEAPSTAVQAADQSLWNQLTSFITSVLSNPGDHFFAIIVFALGYLMIGYVGVRLHMLLHGHGDDQLLEEQNDIIRVICIVIWPIPLMLVLVWLAWLPNTRKAIRLVRVAIKRH